MGRRREWSARTECAAGGAPTPAVQKTCLVFFFFLDMMSNRTLVKQNVDWTSYTNENNRWHCWFINFNCHAKYKKKGYHVILKSKRKYNIDMCLNKKTNKDIIRQWNWSSSPVWQSKDVCIPVGCSPPWTGRLRKHQAAWTGRCICLLQEEHVIYSKFSVRRTH